MATKEALVKLSIRVGTRCKSTILINLLDKTSEPFGISLPRSSISRERCSGLIPVQPQALRRLATNPGRRQYHRSAIYLNHLQGRPLDPCWKISFWGEKQLPDVLRGLVKKSRCLTQVRTDHSIFIGGVHRKGQHYG